MVIEVFFLGFGEGKKTYIFFSLNELLFCYSSFFFGVILKVDKSKYSFAIRGMYRATDSCAWLDTRFYHIPSSPSWQGKVLVKTCEMTQATFTFVISNRKYDFAKKLLRVFLFFGLIFGMQGKKMEEKSKKNVRIGQKNTSESRLRRWSMGGRPKMEKDAKRAC